MTRAAAVLSLLAAMCFTGANVPFGKAIVLEIPIFLFLVFRFAVASAALALIVRGEPGPRLADLSLRQWGDVAILAAVGSVLFTAFMLAGTRLTAAVDAGIITATIPAVVAVLGVVWFRRKPSRGQAALIALAVVGLGVLQVAGSGSGGASSLAGNGLVGIAVLCEAIFVVISQRTSAAVRPIRLSLAVALASLVLSLPFAAGSLASFNAADVSASTWLLAIWYAVSSSVLCTILWYRGAPHVEPWRAGLATAALPVTAVIVSAAYLGESVSVAQLVGGGLVVAAIVVGAVSDGRPQPPAPGGAA